MPYNIDGVLFDFETKRKFSPVYKKQIMQQTLIVPGGGCKYYCDAGGDVCVFCGFPEFARYVVLGPGHEDYFGSWALKPEHYWKMYEAMKASDPRYDKLAIFNGGSFFVDREIPAHFRTQLYSDFATHPTATQLMVESKPEYINEDVLTEATERLEEKDLMVGIGLESANPHIRNKILKKGIGTRTFERSIDLMQRKNVQSFVYVFLKAPELSEGEAVADVLNTIEYLVDLGVDEIAISCAFVPPGTSIEKMFNAGTFRPPWLWSILQIAQISQENEWPVSIGGFEDQPPPVALPNNCPKCDEEVNTLLQIFRTDGKISNELISQQHCDCKQIWNTQMQQKLMTLNSI